MSTRDQIYTARRIAVRNRFVQERRIFEQRAETLGVGWGRSSPERARLGACSRSSLAR
jgi:hypothetical protein